MVVGVGFEPTYATRADLQSAAFNHSATPPNKIMFLKFYLTSIYKFVMLYTQGLVNMKAFIKSK